MFEIRINNHNYISKRLEKAESAIIKIADKMQQNAFAVAWIIARTAETVDDETFAADGFANVHEWTEKVFGFKKAMSYNLLKIGNEFTCEIVNGKTKYYRDNITSPDVAGFTTSQICQLLKYGFETANEAYKAGYISPEMSCREIKENMKKFVADDADAETETEETEEEAETIIVYDENGAKFAIPRKILDKYSVGE